MNRVGRSQCSWAGVGEGPIPWIPDLTLLGQRLCVWHGKEKDNGRRRAKGGVASWSPGNDSVCRCADGVQSVVYFLIGTGTSFNAV